MSDPQEGDIFGPGTLLNNTYRVESVLGRGGLSEVYVARSEISGRRVAVKALRAEYSTTDLHRTLITREENVREIQHDAVVRYFDTQRTPEGVIYLVMDFIDGVPLQKMLRDRSLDEDGVLTVGIRVLAGLDAAHSANIVHRDIAPDNIILRGGDPKQAVIIDFGIAKDTTPDADTIVGNAFAGKLGYAAPEQFSGQTDVRSDIYALGAALLATYRGKAPRLGKQPMEALHHKLKPLDIEGVPEPLASLIATMTEPEADNRFQTARAALESFQLAQAGYPLDVVMRGLSAVTGLEDVEPTLPVPGLTSDQTLTIQRPPKPGQPVDPAQPGTVPPPGTTTAAPLTEPVPVPEPRRSKAPLILLLLAVVAGLGFAGWQFLGQLAPSGLPVADPYSLTLEKPPEGGLSTSGVVPDAATLAALSERYTAADLSLARGDLSDTWAADVLALADVLAPLDDYRVEIEGNAARVTGLSDNRTVLTATEDALETARFPGLDLAVALDLGPRSLPTAEVRPILVRAEDCGPLTLMPPASGEAFALKEPVRVRGGLSDETSRAALQTAIEAIAGARPVLIETEILNPTLCALNAVLPPLAPGGFDVRFGFGETGDPNPTGVYSVGDNPTIDVTLPEGTDEGYLWVILIDVQGVVYNILPNRNRPDQAIAVLREEAVQGRLRVAFGRDEARGTGRIAFAVDDSVIGRSRVAVLHSREPLFPVLRDTVEALPAFTADLAARLADAPDLLLSFDAAILTTER